jgi:hypothetical protein
LVNHALRSWHIVRLTRVEKNVKWWFCVRVSGVGEKLTTNLTNHTNGREENKEIKNLYFFLYFFLLFVWFVRFVVYCGIAKIID